MKENLIVLKRPDRIPINWAKYNCAKCGCEFATPKTPNYENIVLLRINCPFCDNNEIIPITKYKCSFDFKGPFCKYDGPERECNKSLKRCMELKNCHRFPNLDELGNND